MGGGSWTSDSFKTYATSKGYVTINTATRCTDGSLSYATVIDDVYSNQDMFKSKSIDTALNPYGVVRECVDSEEHPNTIPVILALDVTGSMGQTAVEVAKKLNAIMTNLYEKVADVEFMIMGIGDFAYDKNPLQVSQFESDIRIAEQLDKVYFEFGGGGNSYESYTAAWYFGSRHTKLDCWKRDKKGIIITMGDERLNPYLPLKGSRCTFEGVTGDKLQDVIETKDLYKEASEKFDIYHLHVEHGYDWDIKGIENSFKEYMDDNHFRKVSLNNIMNGIVDIIMSSVNNGNPVTNNTGEISW